MWSHGVIHAKTMRWNEWVARASFELLFTGCIILLWVLLRTLIRCLRAWLWISRMCADRKTNQKCRSSIFAQWLGILDLCARSRPPAGGRDSKSPFVLNLLRFIFVFFRMRVRFVLGQAPTLAFHLQTWHIQHRGAHMRIQMAHSWYKGHPSIHTPRCKFIRVTTGIVDFILFTFGGI